MNTQTKQNNLALRLFLVAVVAFFGVRAVAQTESLPAQCNWNYNYLTVKYQVNSQDSLYTAIRSMQNTNGFGSGSALFQLTQGFTLTLTYDQWLASKGYGPAVQAANQVSFIPDNMSLKNSTTALCFDGRGFRITLGWTQLGLREYKGLPLFNVSGGTVTSLDVMRPAINTYLPWWDFASMLLYPQYKSSGLFANTNNGLIDRVNLTGFIGVLKNDYTNSDAIDAAGFALTNNKTIQMSSANITMNAVMDGGCLVRDNASTTSKIIDTRMNCQVNAHIDGDNGLVFSTNKGTISGVEARGIFQAYELTKNAQGQYVEKRSKIGAIYMYKTNQGALSIKVAAHPAVMKQTKTAWCSMQDTTPTSGVVQVKELGVNFNYTSGVNSAVYNATVGGKAVAIQILRQ